MQSHQKNQVFTSRIAGAILFKVALFIFSHALNQAKKVVRTTHQNSIKISINVLKINNMMLGKVPPESKVNPNMLCAGKNEAPFLRHKINELKMALVFVIKP